MKTTRKKRAGQRKLSRKKAKVTAAQKEQHLIEQKLEQRLNRQQKKECQIISTSVTTSPAFKSKASEGKVVQQVSKVLLKSPRKRKVVVKILAINCSLVKLYLKRKAKLRSCLYIQKLYRKIFLIFIVLIQYHQLAQARRSGILVGIETTRKLKMQVGKQ